MADIDTFVPLRERESSKYNNQNNKFEDKPATEQELLLLQDEWLKTHDPVVWKKFQSVIYSYTRSLVLKKLSYTKKYLEEDEVLGATADATFAFMAQYLKPGKDGKPFEIGASFAGVINYKVIEALYKDCVEDHHTSLNSLISEDSSSELEDSLYLYSQDSVKETMMAGDPLEALVKSSLTDELEIILEELDSEINDPYIRLVVRLYIVLCLRRPRSRHAKECFLKTWAADPKCRAVIDLAIKELHSRMTKY